MSKVKIDQLAIPCLKIGEGPHWQEGLQALIFVDGFGLALRRYFLETQRQQVLHLDAGWKAETVSFVIPVEGFGDQFVVGLGNTVSVVKWSPSDPDTHTTTPVILHTSTDHHFNDAKCDPQGRLWAGTMSCMDDNSEPTDIGTSGLYKLDHNIDCSKWAHKVTLSNGMTWSEDKKHFYYIDSQACCIYHFDYDDAEGSISNQRVLLDYERAGLVDQVPDGMTIDVEGNLWVACFGGGQVIVVDPKAGKVVRKVQIPTSQVTSVCWGGPDYSTLYVTTGQIKLTTAQITATPAGGTFAITGLGTKGRPPVNYRINTNKLKAMGINVREKGV